ncbi:MAG: SAM-dependent chlorinase/fluorinase [Flavobacteriales bacterium]|nr:SAM-dependent chlorinase/fluorinase [Flavobacteriales bacterium]MBX2959317.1 SAM-dependent chlorinase/fluorinase [Flavobacteriales bacterium]HRN42259.1 SAM-dependent chlorinase/fluorinase [Vicingus sp.]
MPIITLTTDLGLKDYYVASLKGNILSQLADVNIVDITHNVNPYDAPKAAFIVKQCYKTFPKDTIHIIGLNAELDENTVHLAIYYDGHYFIGADNGMFSLIFEAIPDKIVELNIAQDTDNKTFPTKDIFVKAACHIARGGTLELIGKIKEELNKSIPFQATSENNYIKGMITYVDHYGNLLTNVSESLFKSFGRGRNFTIYLRGGSYKVSKITPTYNRISAGNILAMFSSTGFIEIAVSKGHASKLLGLKETDLIRIEFYD